MENDLIKPYYQIIGIVNQWMHIPRFNGYQINTFGDVRSFKHYKTNEEGYYIKVEYDKHKRPYVYITDDTKTRRKMYIYELMNLAFNPYNHALQPVIGINYCGFGQRIKDIPSTKEERAKRGYAVFDNIREAMTSEDYVTVDLFGNIIKE